MLLSAAIVFLMATLLMVWAARMIWNIQKGRKIGCRSCTLYTIPWAPHRPEKACVLCGRPRIERDVQETEATASS